MSKISRETDKEIKAYLKECSKLKGAALREAYAVVVGRDTNETGRERLLNGIARILYHNAEQGAMVPAFEYPKTDAKPEAKKEGKKAKGRKSETTQTAFADVVSDPAASSHADTDVADDADVDAANDVVAGATGADAGRPGDGAGAVPDAPNGPDNANAGASAGATPDSADGAKKRRAMRASGTRDPRLPPAGTVLEKAYKGVLHKVTLLQDNGCIYEGKQYKSLSGVAKVIAGCNHNGLLFFGLIKRESKAKSSDTSASADSNADVAQAE